MWIRAALRSRGYLIAIRWLPLRTDHPQIASASWHTPSYDVSTQQWCVNASMGGCGGAPAR